MKKVFTAIAIALSLLFASCTTVVPVSAGTSEVTEKSGTSKGGTVLGIILWGDASMAKAAENGNITKIATVDQEVKSYLGIVVLRKTIVTGE